MHTFQHVYELHGIAAFHLHVPPSSILLVALLKQAKLFCKLQLNQPYMTSQHLTSSCLIISCNTLNTVDAVVHGT